MPALGWCGSITSPTFACMARHYAALGKLPAAFSVCALNTSQLMAELGELAVGMGMCQVVPSLPRLTGWKVS
ncbi:hypothetical protein D9M69_670570 [compost metagenome]